MYGASPSEWEVGLGTLDAGGTVLTRTTVFTSSNSDAAVNFTGVTKDVFCTLPASKAVYLDSTGTPVGAASAWIRGGNVNCPLGMIRELIFEQNFKLI
jgi:hypothetical protein